MAQKMTVAPHVTVDELAQRCRGAEDPVARSQWHILWPLGHAQNTVCPQRLVRVPQPGAQVVSGGSGTQQRPP